jgi:hypothetical protein
MSNSTASLPPGERQSWVLNEPVVGVRIVGTVASDADYLLGGRSLYHVGSKPPVRNGDAGAGEIVLDHPHVSTQHCTIEQRNGRWIVFDRGSRNGVFVGDEPERRTMFELVPGLAFRVASVPFVAYSEAGRRARARMQRYFGLTNPFQAAVEGVLRVAGERRHVVLVEPPGGGALGIARALHDSSPRASWPFEIVEQIGGERDQRKILDRVAYGTLVVAAAALPERRVPMIEWLASWDYNVRLVVVAPKGMRLAPVLGERLLTETAIISIPTLAERKAELGTLAAALRHDVAVRLGRMDIDLKPSDLRTIEARPWPENIDELEMYVERLLALRAHNGKLRQAAKWLGKVPGTLVAWKKKYGLDG